VAEDAARVLSPGGWLLVEVGGTQDDALEPELAAHGFVAVTAWRDAEGDLRGMAARRRRRRVAAAPGRLSRISG
jgi:methylase of polypeptide subunit release factors